MHQPMRLGAMTLEYHPGTSIPNMPKRVSPPTDKAITALRPQLAAVAPACLQGPMGYAVPITSTSG